MSTQEEFYLKKFEILSNALNRIKKDEQRWVSVLLLIYGGIFTYLTTLTSTAMFEYLAVFTFLFSIYWIYHATTLRVQYYRQRAKISEIECRLLEWNVEPTKMEWYKDLHPFESKGSEIGLSMLLFVSSNYFLLYRANEHESFRIKLIVLGMLGIAFVWLALDRFRLRNVHHYVKEEAEQPVDARR